MALNVRNLSVHTYNNGFTLWHYMARKENLSEVLSDNYFADASDMLAAGDMIMISAADGGTMRYVTVADLGRCVTEPLS